MAIVSEAAQKVVSGTVQGKEIPGQRAFPATTPRKRALRALATYFSRLIFSREGDAPETPPKRFRVPVTNIRMEQPDDVKEMRLPAIGIIPVPGLYGQEQGLGPAQECEASFGVWAPNTVLLDLGVYVEEFVLETWSNYDPEREAMLAGLRVAMQPLEETSSLRLKLPNYYNLVASFDLVSGHAVDDVDVVRGRRRALPSILMRVPEVLLVDAVTFKPYIQVEVVEAWECLSELEVT